MIGAISSAASGRSGTQTRALSFEKRPNRVPAKTPSGIAQRGSRSASSPSSAPSPPSTSAMPTTPDTASVSTAADTKMKPDSHAMPRRWVKRNVNTVTHAPLAACSSTLNQCASQGFFEKPQMARHTRSGMGRYEPTLRSGGNPQKSRLKAVIQPPTLPLT